MSKRRRVSHPEIAWEDLSRSALRRNGFANKTGTMRRETKKQMENVTERDKKMIQTTERERRMKEERKKEKNERERGLLLLWYYSVLACTTTYTVQSTEQPDTHFRHLRLDALGDQCFHSTLCRHRWLEVYKSVTCKTITTVWVPADHFVIRIKKKQIQYNSIHRVSRFKYSYKRNANWKSYKINVSK